MGVPHLVADLPEAPGLDLRRRGLLDIEGLELGSIQRVQVGKL